MGRYINFGVPLTVTRINTSVRVRFPNNGATQPHTGVVPGTYLQSGVRQVAPNTSGVLKDAGVHPYNENYHFQNLRSEDDSGKVQPTKNVNDRPLAAPKRLPTSFTSIPLNG